MQEYIMPEFFSSAFNCPHCNAFAHQQWSNRVLMIVDDKNPILIDGLSSSNCIKCGKMSYWQDENDLSNYARSATSFKRNARYDKKRL